MRSILISGALLACPSAGLAQTVDSPWDITFNTELSVVAAPGAQEEVRGPDPEGLLWEAGLGLAAERTLASGITIGARGVLRATRDHPARPAGAGNIDLAQLQLPAGAFSRVSVGPQLSSEGERASLESAYVILEGGYGELSVGRDTGVAARFHEGDVGVLGRARLADPILDPSGIATLLTRPDITGPSAKISLVSPRLLGVRAGVSFTPQADAKGLDREGRRDDAALRPGLDNVAEFAVQASRLLREQEVRLRAGASYSTGEVDAPQAVAVAYDDRFSVVALGGEVEWRSNWRFGVNWLRSDDGLSGEKNYTAWTTGLAYERADWRAALVYGQAEIGSIAADSKAFSAELGLALSESVDFSVAWQDRSIDFSPPLAGGALPGGPDGGQIVMEITLALEN